MVKMTRAHTANIAIATEDGFQVHGIKRAGSRKWEAVALNLLPPELRKVPDDLDDLEQRYRAACDAGNEEEATRLHEEFKRREKAWTEAVAKVLQSPEPGKRWSFKYHPRRLDCIQASAAPQKRHPTGKKLVKPKASEPSRAETLADKMRSTKPPAE